MKELLKTLSSLFQSQSHQRIEQNELGNKFVGKGDE
jgi:hypothetical protein